MVYADIKVEGFEVFSKDIKRRLESGFVRRKKHNSKMIKFRPNMKSIFDRTDKFCKENCKVLRVYSK